MRVNPQPVRKARIEILPLIDIVFLLLVFFIYAMLSMAVHRGLPVVLPTSSTAKIDRHLVLSITVRSGGEIYIDKEKTSLDDLESTLRHKAEKRKDAGILLFADKSVSYQELFRVLDQIRMAGLSRISLQAEVDH